MIPIFRPSYGEEEIEAVTEVLKSGWIGLGPKTQQFEKLFAQKVGANHAIATNSGTAALHLACLACGVKPGDEVIVPALTFVSTAHAVSYCGATPVFADIESDYLTLDPDSIEQKITNKTVGIIPVHFAGHPARMAEIWDLAQKYDLFVIEDAAHACGSRYQTSSGPPQSVGGLKSQATCFSFHAVKNLTTGDGGMVTTPDLTIYRQIQALRWCGIDRSTWNRLGELKSGSSGLWDYHVDSIGYKYHMNDIAAALGIVQLKRLPAMNLLRSLLVEQYNRGLGNLTWLNIPKEADWAISSNHAYIIRTKFRDRLYLWLRSRGISSGVHYRPLYHHNCYWDHLQEVLPVTERIWSTLLTLPLFPELKPEQVSFIIEEIIQFGESLGNAKC